MGVEAANFERISRFYRFLFCRLAFFLLARGAMGQMSEQNPAKLTAILRCEFFWEDFFRLPRFFDSVVRVVFVAEARGKAWLTFSSTHDPTHRFSIENGWLKSHCAVCSYDCPGCEAPILKDKGTSRVWWFMCGG